RGGSDRPIRSQPEMARAPRKTSALGAVSSLVLRELTRERDDAYDAQAEQRQRCGLRYLGRRGALDVEKAGKRSSCHCRARERERERIVSVTGNEVRARTTSCRECNHLGERRAVKMHRH